MPFTPQLEGKGLIGAGAAQKSRFELKPTLIEFMATRYDAPPEKGFDNVTYFACQHVPTGSGAVNERPVKLLLKGAGSSPNLTKTGPFNLSGSTSDETGLDFKLTTGNATVDESGRVTESTTLRKLHVVTLPPQNWTIGLYKVDIRDAMGTLHAAPDPPDAGALQDALNDIFGLQANIRFQVSFKRLFTLDLGQITPPQIVYPPSYGSGNGPPNPVSQAMWDTASPLTHLALFWVADLNDALAQAFATPSRGALIGPMATEPWQIAHEIGHCMGLHHCWLPNSHCPQNEIPDVEGQRVMGYGGGKLFRSKEIIKIQQWDPTKFNPITGSQLP